MNTLDRNTIVVLRLFCSNIDSHWVLGPHKNIEAERERSVPIQYITAKEWRLPLRNWWEEDIVISVPITKNTTNPITLALKFRDGQRDLLG